MMIKKNKVKRGGRIKTWIVIVEGYRPGLGAAPKQRVVKSFGYLEDQAEPEKFMEMVEEYNATYKAEKRTPQIEATGTARMYSEERRKQNYGYKYLEAIYDMLGIDKIIEGYMKEEKFQGKYSVSKIFKFLVILRLLNPDSKRATFQLKDGFYGMETQFNLPDIYGSLDKIADFEIEIQRHLNEIVKTKIGRDLSYAFYDVTNYFFEIDYPDGEDDISITVEKHHFYDSDTTWQ